MTTQRITDPAREDRSVAQLIRDLKPSVEAVRAAARVTSMSDGESGDGR